jgi:hypothetical protein
LSLVYVQGSGVEFSLRSGVRKEKAKPCFLIKKEKAKPEANLKA